MSTTAFRSRSMPFAVAAALAGSLLLWHPVSPRLEGGDLAGATASATASATMASSRGNAAPLFGSFVQNQGQWDAKAQFLARAPGVNLWITERGAVFDFYAQHREGAASGVAPFRPHRYRQRGHVVSMEFVGGRSSATRGFEQRDGEFNFLKGNDSARWITGVPHFAETRSERVYNGIEARWYFDRGLPRYDLIVSPGADPGQIRMQFRGTHGVAASGRVLSITTAIGTIEQRDLLAYQVVSGKRSLVGARLHCSGNVVSFELGKYDHAKPLVVDPLLWSTLFGGNGGDAADSVAIDDHDRPFITGYCNSSDMPTTVGAYDDTYNEGGGDVYVAKIDAFGENLLWCTYIGGGGQDISRQIALTPGGNPVVAGVTQSTDYPTTLGAFQSSPSGSEDGFISKLSVDGRDLMASTYLGGSDWDDVDGLVLDSAGRPIVCGGGGTGFPITAGNPLSGTSDAFVAKLSGSLKSLIFSRFLGGSSLDRAFGIALDSNSRILLTGYTYSSNFPVTASAIDQAFNNSLEAFVAKLRPDGTVIWSTYLGGSGNSVGFSIDSDSVGNVVCAGGAESSDFPTTQGAYDRTVGATSNRDGFISKISADGTTLLASTLFGSDEFQDIRILRVNKGSIFGSGSGSHLEQTTSWGFDPVNKSGGFFFEMNGGLSTLKYGTVIRGGGTGLVFDTKGRPILAGSTGDPGFALTGRPVDDSVYSFEGFLAKFETTNVGIKANPRSLEGGTGIAKGTIVLTSPAPAGGTLIPLATTTSKLTVPDFVSVPAGARSANFEILAHAVADSATGMVSAKFGPDEQFLLFQLNQGGLGALSLDPDTVYGGRTSTGTVTLLAPVPAFSTNAVGGKTITIKLSSSLASAQVPASVTMSSGATQANFTITTSMVGSRKRAVISAKYGNDTVSQTLTINP